ncbi:methyltransferase domain-containing protein [Pikeienuella piscinae]|uniref:Methyltransferase domain-containing protein n=1 Tax=Pikeienuella piscinae TaxID=2748098 RepID=A0A7L5BWU5_9RHOB|nr:methyltransferase domain-containing protein [Pikeienuella piscinae]QIE55298.1 methyltransferase domain-containing protein [Pikeienuella piscinae]
MNRDGLGGWKVAAYEAFGDLRLRPALDLLARVPELPAGALVDLGCGSGAAASALRARFPGRRLIGVDRASEMLAKAAPLLDEAIEADIADWGPAAAALIFSNAALHWLPDHATLIPALFAALAPGGVLAVQMPGQLDRPSHRTMIGAAAAIRPDLFCGWKPFPGPLPLPDYAGLLPRAGLDLWETEYLQRLGPADGGGHPVRAFVSATGARPILALLDAAERARFEAGWDEALGAAYPVGPDGCCWFPFRRFFFVARSIGSG